MVKRLVYTQIMAFIMFSFTHIILKFRDSCKDYYSQLVVHSQSKVTLSPVLVQAFLLLRYSLYLLYVFPRCRKPEFVLYYFTLFLSLKCHLPCFLFYLVAEVKPGKKGLEKSEFVTIAAFGHRRLFSFRF